MTDTNALPLTIDTIKLGRHYLIITDGSCPGNSGPCTGGWAAVLQLKDGEEVIHQTVFAGQVGMIATNNRMEMMAPIAALRALAEPGTPVLVVSDSQILVNGMTAWMPKWKGNGWKSKSGLVSNRDIWEELNALNQSRVIFWQWVKGHNGHELNELADELATSAAAGKNVDENGKVTRFRPGLKF